MKLEIGVSHPGNSREFFSGSSDAGDVKAKNEFMKFQPAASFQCPAMHEHSVKV